jgi:hypothetical protein
LLDAKEWMNVCPDRHQASGIGTVHDMALPGEGREADGPWQRAADNGRRGARDGNCSGKDMEEAKVAAWSQRRSSGATACLHAHLNPELGQG